MERKDHIDRFGAAALIGLMLLLAFNQVLVKVTNNGFQPVFLAGLRSLGSILCVGLWLWWRGKPVSLGSRDIWPLAIVFGLVFSTEFLLLFIAIDLTTVSRSSIFFYAMPIWMALGAHFFLQGDRLTTRKIAGLILAMTGVVIAMTDRSGGQGSLTGDLLALSAGMAWAAIGLIAKGTRLKTLSPEAQLLWQVAISAPVLLLLSPMFGPLIREVAFIHIAAFAFQIIAVVTFGFVLWFWLLSIYPGSGVASFSFLAPVFGVFLGWALLGEEVGLGLIAALALVAAGIVLINRPARRSTIKEI